MPVAAALDVAFTYFIAKAIFPRREGPIAFLLLIAVVSDALFFATAIMPPGPLLGELKLGALSTAAGAAMALAAARILRVGRFTATQAGKPTQRLAWLHM